MPPSFTVRELCRLGTCDGEDPKILDMRVYFADEINAIPKLNLTDTEMSQVASLLCAVAWIRMMQMEGIPSTTEAMHDHIDQIYSGLNQSFCQAQIKAVQSLGDKFGRYLRDNDIPPYTWPTV